MSSPLSASAARVQAALAEAGVAARVVELPDSTRTAAEAAAAIGCRVEEIAKSLVFRGAESGKPILVVASGTNRVDEKRVATLIGEKIAKADAEFVRERTGYAIGGIPPVGHLEKLTTLIDEDLLTFERIWAAAGTPHAVFELTPQQLVMMTGGTVAAVAKIST